jgi:hypothetical protein
LATWPVFDRKWRISNGCVHSSAPMTPVDDSEVVIVFGRTHKGESKRDRERKKKKGQETNGVA